VGWDEVGKKMLEAASGSFGRTIGQFGEAITHPGETLGALGQIGTGLLSKGAGFFDPNQDKRKKPKMRLWLTPSPNTMAMFMATFLAAHRALKRN
jgi:hypothetical protein